MSESTAEATDAAPEAAEEKVTKADAPEADAELQAVDTEDAWDPKRAKEKIRKLNQEIQTAKARLAEAPKADDVAAKDQRIGDLETASLRYEIALDLGLPKEIAVRLQGKDRDEMVADAEKLLELLSPAKKPATRKPIEALRGGGEPDKEPEETDIRKLGERMFRS